MSRHLIGSAILGLSLFAAVGARAQSTVVLPATGTSVVTLNVGGWSVQFNNALGTNACAFNRTGVASSDCSWEEAVGTVDSGGNLTITFQPNPGHTTPLSNLLQLNGSPPSSIQDLSVSELITAPGGKNIKFTTLKETGQAPSGVLLSASEQINNAANSVVLGTDAVAVPADGSLHTVSASVGITPSNSIFVTKDIKVQGTSGANAFATNVQQVFNVPEPASLSVLAIGIGGLLGLRRRRAQA